MSPANPAAKWEIMQLRVARLYLGKVRQLVSHTFTLLNKTQRLYLPLRRPHYQIQSEGQGYIVWCQSACLRGGK